MEMKTICCHKNDNTISRKKPHEKSPSPISLFIIITCILRNAKADYYICVLYRYARYACAVCPQLFACHSRGFIGMNAFDRFGWFHL